MRRTKTFPRTSFIACAALGVLFLASCSPDPDNRPKGGTPAPVRAAVAEVKDVPVEIKAIGTVQAFSTVSIRPQITGPILEVHFQEGQDVKAGDLLFTIDPRRSEAALKQAEANVKRDEAQLVGARLEFDRTRRLFESNIASRDDFDKAEATFQSLQATVLADYAAVSNAQVNLDYSTIRSPVDGRAGIVSVKAGNVVKAPDDVLVTVNQIRPINVLFSVPEQNLPAIRRRMQEATLPVKAAIAGEDQSACGELSVINNAVDVTTGTIQLKATFPNDGNRLWPGQFVQTTLTLSNLVQATLVPAHAVQSSQSGDFVYVIQGDDTVERRPVVTGILRENFVVITSGVAPGEKVVTDGHLRVAPGSKVRVTADSAAR